MSNADNQLIIPTDNSNQMGEGFFKVWKSNPVTGEASLLVDKKNTIVYGGSDLLALALAGQDNASISHVYLQYAKNSVPGSPPAITKADDITSFPSGGTDGYFRIPLSFPATFSASSNTYVNNTVVFTVLLNSFSGLNTNLGINPAVDNLFFYRAGLVAAINPAATTASHATDLLFARIGFDTVEYDPTFNFTISWGCRFTS